MNPAHLHLLLNHVPVLGAVFAAVILAAGLLRDDVAWQRLALWMLVVAGVAAVATFFTGESAEEVVEGAAGFSEAALEEHEELGEIAMYSASVVGAAALLVLAWFRGRRLPRRAAVGMLALGLALSGLMAWTANAGGKVNHPELRGEVSSGGETAAGAVSFPEPTPAAPRRPPPPPRPRTRGRRSAGS